MRISLDRQVITEHCAECGHDFTTVRGSVYDDGKPIGLYLIALHGHSPDGRLGHLAIALLDSAEQGRHPTAVAIDVIATPDQFGFVAIDWADSPWRKETYLGEMLDREPALASQNWPAFLHVAEHVVEDLPEAKTYFG
jgi:hypothetical protein